jgi:hypothetical protein
MTVPFLACYCSGADPMSKPEIASSGLLSQFRN